MGSKKLVVDFVTAVQNCRDRLRNRDFILKDVTYIATTTEYL